MVSASKTFALWTRLSAPLPSAGYPFLVLTFVGWIWALVKEGGEALHPRLDP